MPLVFFIYILYFFIFKKAPAGRAGEEQTLQLTGVETHNIYLIILVDIQNYSALMPTEGEPPLLSNGRVVECRDQRGSCLN